MIPTNTEKYISFIWRNYRFIDSLAFLNTSLEKLVRNTPADDFCHTSSQFGDAEMLELLLRKGVYPYEYMDDFAKFDETTLPPKETFHSSLSDEVSVLIVYAFILRMYDILLCIHMKLKNVLCS